MRLMPEQAIARFADRWDQLDAKRPLTRRELGVASAGLGLVAVAVFGAHIARGGFYADDWGNAAEYHFIQSPEYFHSVAARANSLGSRPLLAVLLPIPHALFGAHPAPQIALGIALGVLTCAILYGLLRTIGVASIHAGAIAVLTLLFPWADSVRLWATASLNTVAICFGLLGLWLSLGALTRHGRAAQRLHGAGIVLFMLSILTYEVMAAALMLTGLLYVMRVGLRARALRWWAADAAAVGAALVYTALTSNKHAGSIDNSLHNVPVFAREALAILSLSFVPPGVTSTPPRVLVLLSLGAAVVWFWLRGGAEPDSRRWLAFVGVAGGALVCGYAIVVGSYLTPLDAGIQNRGNIFAALGFVALAYGFVAVLAKVVARGRRIPAAIMGLALTTLVASGYVVRLIQDEDAYAKSASLQEELLDESSRVMALAPPGMSVVTFGFPAAVAGGPQIFDAVWDLDAAMRLRTGGRVAHAYPFYDGARLRCYRRSLTILLPVADRPVTIPYSSAYFFDVPTRRTSRVKDRPSCQEERLRFRPGPREIPR